MVRVKSGFTKIRESQANLHKEIKEKTVVYILAAVSFVAGLAWNEAIKSLIDQFFPNSSNSVLIKFIYAVIVTIIIVLVTVYLSRISQDKKTNN